MDDANSVTGGNRRRVQVRKAMRAAFTPTKQQAFLDHLAGCANVTRAAAAAGAGVSTVYDARRRDPAFAAQWDDAIDAGYATLEALLIERAALGSDTGAYVPGDTPVPGPETIDTWLALDLLRLSRMGKAPRDKGGAPPRRASEKALAEKIEAKLAVLAARRRKGKTPGKALRSAASTSSQAPRDARGEEKAGPGRDPNAATPHPPKPLAWAPPSPARGEGLSGDE